MTEPTADITTTKPDPIVEPASVASPATAPAASVIAAEAGDAAAATTPPLNADAADAARADVTPADVKAERPAAETRTQPSFADLLARLRADTVVVPYRRSLLAGAALLVATAVGFGGGRLTGRHHAASVERADTEMTAGLRQTHDDVAHLGAELKALRVAVDGMKATRGELATKQAQLVDRTEKLGSETATRIGKIGEQLERIEKTQRDPARVAALMERLDRIEKQGQPAPLTVAAAPAVTPTPPPKPLVASSDITQTGSLPDTKPAAAKAAEFDPRKTALDGYVLRDLDEGDYALVENRQGRLFEVRPGSNLPGIGRIEAIERRGRRWVVITPKGYIAER